MSLGASAGIDSMEARGALRARDYGLALPALVLTLAMLDEVGAQLLGYLVILLYAFCFLSFFYFSFALLHKSVIQRATLRETRRCLFLALANAIPIGVILVQAYLRVWL